MNLKVRGFVLFSFLFVMLFLVSGCTDETPEESVFVGGDEGVEVSFVSGNPPNTVFQNKRFSLVMKLENKGEADLYPGQVYLLFNNANNFGVESEDLNSDGFWNVLGKCDNSSSAYPNSLNECETIGGSQRLIGVCSDDNSNGILETPIFYDEDRDCFKEKDSDSNGKFDSYVSRNIKELSGRFKQEGGYVPGGVEYISYETLKYSGQETLTEESPVSLSAEVCYPYETTAVADVCVSIMDESDICDISGDLEVENSGAPVKVSFIEQKYSGYSNKSNDEVSNLLKIGIEQDGGGTVYSSDVFCVDKKNSKGYLKKNYVTIKFISIGNQTFSYKQPSSEGGCIDEIENGDVNCDSNKNRASCLNEKGCIWKSEISDICGGSDEVILVDGSGHTFCDIPIKGVYTDYEDRFVIKLGYLHSYTKNKAISVVPV